MSGQQLHTTRYLSQLDICQNSVIALKVTVEQCHLEVFPEDLLNNTLKKYIQLTLKYWFLICILLFCFNTGSISNNQNN